MVRLKEEDFIITQILHLYFNSNMVRLKDLFHLNECYILELTIPVLVLT